MFYLNSTKHLARSRDSLQRQLQTLLTQATAAFCFLSFQSNPEHLPGWLILPVEEKVHCERERETRGFNNFLCLPQEPCGIHLLQGKAPGETPVVRAGGTGCQEDGEHQERD